MELRYWDVWNITYSFGFCVVLVEAGLPSKEKDTIGGALLKTLKYA